nr:VWA-like domain-containing protein [uncultured Blautia sp.]
MRNMDRQELLGKRILQNCRNELYLDFPYLDGAFASLEYETDNSIITIGTDGEKIYFNPSFLLKKYVEDPAAVRRGYLHMLLHCLYLHIFMMPDKDTDQWNRECDSFVENLIDKFIQESGSHSLKKRSLNDTEMTDNSFDDHTLWQRTAGQMSGGRRTKEKWERVLAYTSQNKTGTQSRAGTQTTNRQEELDEIYRSRYDYRKFLKQFCRLREEVELDTESFDYIFYHFGMEHYGNLPLIEPLEYKEVNRLEELVIAIDTSGSCSKETVQRFLGETYAILSEKENFFSRMKVYIIQCDCFIQKVDVIHSEEEWKEYSRKMTIQGRGGTDFRPVFELIRQEKERKELKNLRALIYFTDGDGIYPRQKPDYETAFVFLNRTDKMKLVPSWAKCLITKVK